MLLDFSEWSDKIDSSRNTESSEPPLKIFFVTFFVVKQNS